jgi:hypothetical protein
MKGDIVTAGERSESWLGRHRRLALGVATALYASALVWGLTASSSTYNPGLLLTLPLALLALTFGTRAGIGAALLSVGVIVLTASASATSLGVVGYGTRAAPMLALGIVLGTASDGLRYTAELERRLARAHQRERETAEINDSIIQRLAVAKWSLEAGNDQRSLELLTDSIHTAQALVADLLRERPHDTELHNP